MSGSKRVEQRRPRAPPPLQSKEPGPPLASPKSPGPTPTKLSRISHACDRCRVMRTKCSGGMRCTKCIKDNAPCVYGDGKRERNKKDLAESNQRIDMLEEDVTVLVSTLRDLAANSRFHADEFPEIVHLLSKYPIQDAPESSRASTERLSPTHSRSRGGGEEQVSAEVGSPGGQGALANVVELGHGSGAAGFIGKMSEISWMQRAREHLIRDANSVIETSQIELDQHDKDAKELNYFMDDVDLLSVDEDSVVPQEMPPQEISLILAEACFHALQGVFPFIHRESFLRVLTTFPHGKHVLSWVERRWLAMANLVFALGTKWLHQTGRQNENFHNSHLEYYARARALGLDHRIVFDHPVLEQVQALGMLALYLFVNGSIARAWTVLGHAIRHATALGLHLRIADPTIASEDRELRARTWYSLYSLEILITETLGRPKSVALVDMTTPIATIERRYSTLAYSDQILSQYGPESKSRQLWLDFLRNGPSAMAGMDADPDILSPVPLLDYPAMGQPPPPAHFPHRIRLCVMSHRIGTALYSAGEDQTWSDVQRKIAVFEFEMAQWLASLPPDLTIPSSILPSSSNTSPLSPHPSTHTNLQYDPRSKLEINLYYHSVQMILYRPCICNWTNKITNESEESKAFNLRCAHAAVQAAMSMLALMPDFPTAEIAYQLLPWWALLHYVCQAAAVLIMELSLEAEHAPTEIHGIVGSLKKAMTYLWCLTPGSLSAFRAYKIFRQLLTDATAAFVGIDLSDVPLEAVQPTNWSLRDEISLHEALVAANTTSPNPGVRATILGHARML